MQEIETDDIQLAAASSSDTVQQNKLLLKEGNTSLPSCALSCCECSSLQVRSSNSSEASTWSSYSSETILITRRLASFHHDELMTKRLKTICAKHKETKA